MLSLLKTRLKRYCTFLKKQTNNWLSKKNLSFSSDCQTLPLVTMPLTVSKREKMDINCSCDYPFKIISTCCWVHYRLSVNNRCFSDTKYATSVLHAETSHIWNIVAVGYFSHMTSYFSSHTFPWEQKDQLWSLKTWNISWRWETQKFRFLSRVFI